VTFYRSDKFEKIDHGNSSKFWENFPRPWAKKSPERKNFNGFQKPAPLLLKERKSDHNIAVYNFHANFNPSPIQHEGFIKHLLEPRSIKLESGSFDVMTSVCVGDFNATVLPKKDIVNGVTNVQGKRVNYGKQGAMCIDGCFCQNKGSNPKQA